ncbi:hypothetical protein GQ53DRAFT_744964 [Thozetella sp. PMI_491]|nr:hypothetical protein GQ53DRAFT_744964 [Thozetella sp. PMI_491]
MASRIWRPAPRSLGSLTLAGAPTRCSSALLVAAPPTATPRLYATAASLGALKLPEGYVPSSQPPSARPPETRKSQLLRTYTSMLRSSPLMLVFQHNNLTALEWAAVRRELRAGLQRAVIPPAVGPDGALIPPPDVASKIGIQVVRTSMLDVALRIVELERLTGPLANAEDDAASAPKGKKAYNHDLSRNVWKRVDKAMKDNTLAESRYGELSAMLTGPIAVVAFPAITPAHLAEVLKILAPSAPNYPAPTRKKSPGYYDLAAQTGLQKLLLVGGRLEGKPFDMDGIRWVGGIEGGIDGLRAQLIHMLQSAGMGLTAALEGASKSLWFTMENRKAMLEEEQKGPSDGEAKAEESS